MALIEREAALEICEKEYQERLRMLDYCGDTVAWNIGNAIKGIPTIDVAPVVHGRWKTKRGNYITGGGNPLWECNRCGHIYGASLLPPKYHFCPNCGARMDGGEEHEAD